MRMVMKMAAVSAISLLLLCCSAISSTDSKEKCDYNVAAGANFTVPMPSAVDKSYRLRWKHNGTYILDRRNGVFLIGDKKLISEDGSLKLTNVIKNNTGSYGPEVLDKDGKNKGSFDVKHLCVIDRVPMPVVKATCMKLQDVTFTCKVQATVRREVAEDVFVEKTQDLEIKWLQNNKELEKETSPTLTRRAEQVKTDSFSCKVSNSVSFLISEAVKQSCIEDSFFFFFPETLLGINTWIFVGAGGGVVLLLIIVVIVCCVRTKRRKSLQLKEEGELRLAWTNDQHKHHQHNDPQDHHHHHHPHQQPAGHTGPRQQRSKQQRPRNPDQPIAHPQPSPRRPAQAPRPPGNIDEEQPPPLPQPRKIIKKAPKAQRV